MKAKKILTNMLCASMVVSNITPAFATVTNETSTFDDTTESILKETEVLYEKAGKYFVTIPKTITLGADKQSLYSVKVEGDIASDKQVYVSPIDVIKDTDDFDFYMKDLNTANPKADVVATVTQNKFYWNFSEVSNGYEETNNHVVALDLTSGTWEGTFDFEINMHTYNNENSDNDTQTFEAGLYDADGVLLCSWEDSGIHNTCSDAKSVIKNTYPTTTKVIISNSVTSIYNGAFDGCTSLKNVVIPDSVTSIGIWTFRDCTSLTEINIPNSVTSIGNEAFQGCTALININIPDSVTRIGSSAFKDCTSLTEIDIPNSVTSIGGSTFYNCTALTNINIPDSVTSIVANTFYGCTALININIPNSVTTIYNDAFYGCTSLTNLIIPDSVTSIGNSAFKDVPHITYNGTASGKPWGALSIN